MTRRVLLSLSLVLGGFCLGPVVTEAEACPMCKAGNEAAGDPRPRAYMYSILFMLAVPATIFSSIGVGLYRLNRAEIARLDEADEG